MKKKKKTEETTKLENNKEPEYNNSQETDETKEGAIGITPEVSDSNEVKLQSSDSGLGVSEKSEDLSAQLAEMHDKYLRLYAEFDNFRKRTVRERIEITKTASAEVISCLLPVLDDCDRAGKSMETASDLQAVKDGIVLIHTKFRNIIAQAGVEEIKAIGEDFDTDVHEAVANVPAENEELKGKIIDQVEKGYFLNGKVIRFAKVIVSV